MKMTVDFKLIGVEKKAQQAADQELEYYITDAYILVKRPNLIRIIGLLYKITAFDMVSDGAEFSIFVPQKSKIFHGMTSGKVGKVQGLSINLRPQHIFQAIAMNALEGVSENNILVEAENEGRKSYYILYVLKQSADGHCVFDRKIWFDRLDLSVIRQKIFGEDNQVESDVSYSNYQLYDGSPYPAYITIKRPQDDMSLVIRAHDIKVNIPLEDEKFHLNQPEGVELIDLSQNPEVK
jgi:outer membrane lipoprotein-sorting protein